jgi:Carboxypeptidase regulatory-like domain
MGANVLVLEASSGTLTDSSGHFSMPYIPPGTYRVLVRSPEYFLYESTGVRILPGETTHLSPVLRVRPLVLRVDSAVIAAPRQSAAIMRPVVVKRGVLYFGGHRIKAPLKIDFAPGVAPGKCLDMVVNGRKLHRDHLIPPGGAPTHRDTLTWRALWTASKLAKQGVQAGVPRREILSSIATNLAGKHARAVVEVDTIRVTYPDFSEIRLVFPRYSPGAHKLTREEGRNRQMLDAYGWLTEAKRVLGRGGLMTISVYGCATVPPPNAPRVDGAMRTLQRGERLTDAQRDLLMSTLPRYVEAELRNPAPLDRVK